MFRLPIRNELSEEDVKALAAFSKLCRQDIIKMTFNAGSGHPGGSCSIIDVLAVLYSTMKHYPPVPGHEDRDRVVFSAGHLSPAAYSVLAEMGYFPAEEMINGFRKGTPFAGHVEHALPGVEFTNGSLAKGLSQAAGIAHAAKLLKKNFRVYCIMGDGEQEEGQVAEARRSVTKYCLNNLTVIIDGNRQQLESPLDETAPTMRIKEDYLAAGFAVYEIDGHDYGAIYRALAMAKNSEKPVMILANTVMGKGVSFMEEAARKKSSEWHGKAPNAEQAERALSELRLSEDEQRLLKKYYWNPATSPLDKELVEKRKERLDVPRVLLETGTPTTYPSGTLMDNRTAFGNALADLGRLNPGKMVAMTCDLGKSVKMSDFAAKNPGYFIDEGISEQHMISKAGALSLNGFCVFASTFGVFLSALAADQVRINDINHARVKMVATHCGLSVGQDGMTHQCITDLGFMRGLFNTIIIEPSDPNQTDHAVRFAANMPENVYIRMGRAPNALITRLDGTPFYDGKYVFRVGATDIIRLGDRLVVVASGSMVAKVQQAVDSLNNEFFKGKQKIALLAFTTLNPVDEETFLEFAVKAKGVLTLEDHNPETGLGSVVAGMFARAGLKARLNSIGVLEYSKSAGHDELYKEAGLSVDKIKEKIKILLK